MARGEGPFNRMTAAAVGAALLLASGASSALAQDQIQLAEKRVTPLQLFGSSNSNSNSRREASDSVRMNNLEEQLRRLNGQVEELTHRLQQMQDQMQRMQGDIEFRLQELENGKGRRSDATPPAVPSTNVAPAAQSDFQASGQPPQLLGTVPADDLPADNAGSNDEIGRVIGQPLDLSALARGQQSYDGDRIEDDGLQNQQFASVQPTSPRDAYDIAYGHVLRGEYDRAETSFRNFLDQYPQDPLAPSAKYWLGESLYSRGDYSEASQQFLALYTDYPDSEKAPDALLKLGQSLVRLGEAGTACATFSEMLSKYPQAARAVRARAQSEQRKAGC